MEMASLIVKVPKHLKTKLDAERKRGVTAAGLIRHLLEEHFKKQKAA